MIGSRWLGTSSPVRGHFMKKREKVKEIWNFCLFYACEEGNILFIAPHRSDAFIFHLFSEPKPSIKTFLLSFYQKCYNCFVFNIFLNYAHFLLKTRA